MKRPGYREAVEWLAGNDDSYYISGTEYDAHGPLLSVAMTLVRDLWDVTDEKLISDILRAVKRIPLGHRR